MKKNSARAKHQLPTAILLALLLGACASYDARYTPASVAAPPSLAIAACAPERELTEKPSQAGDNTNPARVISLHDAVKMAFARNRSLAAQSFAPEIAETAIAEARAAFDPTISTTASYREQNRPGSTEGGTVDSTRKSGAASSNEYVAAFETASALVSETATLIEALSDSTPITTTEDTGVEMRVSEFLPTGTELFISGTYARSASSALEDTGYSGAWTVGVTQSLLRGFGTDVNLVALRQARNNAAISTEQFRAQVLDLVERVERGYWNLALAQETVGIRQASLELAEEQLKLNERLIAVGKLAGSASVSAKAEVARARANLVDAQADLEDEAILLWNLLNPSGQPPDAGPFEAMALPPVSLPGWDVDASIALAMRCRPELAQARLDIANSDLNVVQAKNGLLPKLDLYATYGTSSDGTSASAWNDALGDTTYDAFEVGATFSYTLGNRAGKARHKRALLQQDQAEAVLHSLEQSLEAEVRRAVVEVVRQQERMAASKQEVLQREEELRIERDQFRLGRSTNLDVLQVQRDLIQAKVDAASAHVGLLQALSGLYAAEGTLLTRRGIVIENPKEMES